jgi:4-amino-4-deoxy-L-arabinose transferase-like glycosyltransferase
MTVAVAPVPRQREMADYAAPADSSAVRRPSYRLALLILAIIGAGAALRLWQLRTSSAWQWDEAVYYRIAANLQQHGVLREHSVLDAPTQPFLYQPPFYMLLLSKWFSAVGASILHARILGVILTAAMQIVLFRLLWKLHGYVIALFVIVPVVFDGWLIYIERVSFIENALMVLLVVALLLYQRALERPSYLRFAIAGLAVGAATDFKQTGVYAVLVVLLCWLITRRSHRQHLALLGVTIAAIVAYTVVMTVIFNKPGHPYFTDQSLLQIRRTLGLQSSGGTLTSPGAALHLLFNQYRYFIPSAVAGGAALVIAARRTWQCYRARNWQPAQPNALLYSWLVSGVVVFGLSSLKYPQYFALVLVPSYCFLWSEVARWDWSSAWKNLAMGQAATLGIGSFLLTIPAFTGNSLASTQHYAATQIPSSAIVVTEQAVGDLIQQRWCTVEKATACDRSASYAITWRTYLQSSFDRGNVAFHHLMQGAVAVRTFSGPVGTATVWKLRTVQ